MCVCVCVYIYKYIYINVYKQNQKDGVGHGSSYVVEVVMNAIGREGSDCSFHVVSFVVDGKIETELQIG